MSQGKLIVISGASGVGKGTVLKLVMEQRSDLFFSVSATTRPPRPGEVDGKHYFFVTTERFRDMIHRDAFLEYDRHNDYYYGTPRDHAPGPGKMGNGAAQLVRLCGCERRCPALRPGNPGHHWMTPPLGYRLRDESVGRGLAPAETWRNGNTPDKMCRVTT